MKVFLFLACATALAAQQPQGINFYSIGKEIALGDQLAAAFQRNTAVASDARVEKLGAALVPQSSPYQYRFRVFDGAGSEPVTFAGGWVFVPRPLLARDDRQLAAILAQAIAHVELRHATRLATKRELNQIGRTVAETAVPEGQRPPAVPDTTLRLQRAFELEADARAVRLLRDAGYDPAGLVEYLRTLPDSQARIEAAVKAIRDLPQ